MSLEWRVAQSTSMAWSNPVAWWWGSADPCQRRQYRDLVPAVSRTARRRRPAARQHAGIEIMLLLCAAYVFGCAFRSFLPRADVQRICLFDTWLSSVFVGRSVATVAEIAFAAQWAIILHQLGTMTGADTTVNAALVIVPLIVIAECFSWHAVLTTKYLHNAIENSIWAVVFFIVGVGLCRLLPEFEGAVRMVLIVSIVGIVFLSGVSDDRRCSDVSEPVAGRWRRRKSAAETARGAARRQHALDRDARSCRVEGRDRLDVAVFQPGGMVESGAMCVLFAGGSAAALSYAGDDDDNPAGGRRSCSPHRSGF